MKRWDEALFQRITGSGTGFYKREEGGWGLGVGGWVTACGAFARTQTTFFPLCESWGRGPDPKDPSPWICPWIVQTYILQLIIDFFQAGENPLTTDGAVAILRMLEKKPSVPMKVLDLKVGL